MTRQIEAVSDYHVRLAERVTRWSQQNPELAKALLAHAHVAFSEAVRRLNQWPTCAEVIRSARGRKAKAVTA